MKKDSFCICQGVCIFLSTDCTLASQTLQETVFKQRYFGILNFEKDVVKFKVHKLYLFYGPNDVNSHFIKIGCVIADPIASYQKR